MSSVLDHAAAVGMQAQLEYLAAVATDAQESLGRTRNVLAAAAVAAGGELTFHADVLTGLSGEDTLDTWQDEDGTYHVAVVRAAAPPAEPVGAPAPAAPAPGEEEEAPHVSVIGVENGFVYYHGPDDELVRASIEEFDAKYPGLRPAPGTGGLAEDGPPRTEARQTV